MYLWVFMGIHHLGSICLCSSSSFPAQFSPPVYPLPHHCLNWSSWHSPAMRPWHFQNGRQRNGAQNEDSHFYSCRTLLHCHKAFPLDRSIHGLIERRSPESVSIVSPQTTPPMMLSSPGHTLPPVVKDAQSGAVEKTSFAASCPGATSQDAGARVPPAASPAWTDYVVVNLTASNPLAFLINCSSNLACI